MPTLTITTGRSRKSTNWRREEITWDELCTRLSNTHRTHETIREYTSMSKARQAEIKDVGGFVGGTLSGKRRLKGSVITRSLITLDADYAPPKMWERSIVLNDFAMCCYSTHKHTEEKPRLRFVIPLKRPVTPEEYEPLARLIADDMCIQYFDVTTYDVGRLMYWPSTPSDGDFEFHRQHGELLDPDVELARYRDWRDPQEWPHAKTEQAVRQKEIKRQGDPTGKKGIVGLFCRTYDVPTAISTFLNDVYQEVAGVHHIDGGARYTYTKGSTVGGLVLYQDGAFAYSHHGTDPCSGLLCNAFDLVRIHMFGVRDLDESVAYGTPVTKLPSYLAMQQFASELPEVTKLHLAERRVEAATAFAEPITPNDTPSGTTTITPTTADDEDYDDAWMEDLEVNTKTGEVKPSIKNLLLILENDPCLKGGLAYNTFYERKAVLKDLPWRRLPKSGRNAKRVQVDGDQWMDVDESGLRAYLETNYGIESRQKVLDALELTCQKHTFHPVRDYLHSITWDDTPRLDTMLIDYMGAEDDIYTREATRKWMCGAVARVMEPGCKFDTLIVLVGKQGIGKSYLASKLGRYWFSDTLMGVGTKEALEQLQGKWIIELAELAATYKKDSEKIKAFLAASTDNFRRAYGRNSQEYQRQCVFYGSTNDRGFLRDLTGNRRYWAIAVDPPRDKLFKELTDAIIDQLWAEAYQRWKDGEKRYLSPKAEAIAIENQEDFLYDDPRVDEVAAYLDKPIPENWYELSKATRQEYIQNDELPLNMDPATPLMQREFVSLAEVAHEFLCRDVKHMQKRDCTDWHDVLRRLPGWHQRENKKGNCIKYQIPGYGRSRVYDRCEGESCKSESKTLE